MKTVIRKEFVNGYDIFSLRRGSIVGSIYIAIVLQ